MHFKKKQLFGIGNKDYPAYTSVQKKNLILIDVMVTLTSASAVISACTKNVVLSSVCKKIDVSYLALIGSLIASAMNLGDIDAIIKNRVPWKTLIMISGISMLIGVAKQSGLLDLLGNSISSNKSVFFLPALLVLVSGCMSLFSSAVSVVIPTLFPIIPIVAANTNYKIALLYSCIILGASISGVSPFSTGGAIVVGCVTDNSMRDKMMYRQLAIALAGIVIGAIYMEVRCHLNL